jgi:hypothetical protein
MNPMRTIFDNYFIFFVCGEAALLLHFGFPAGSEIEESTMDRRPSLMPARECNSAKRVDEGAPQDFIRTLHPASRSLESMKRLLLPALILCIISTSFAADLIKKATLNRASSGKVLDERGFTVKQLPLLKGMTYDVTAEAMGNVTIKVDGQTVRVAKSDVTLAEVAATPTPKPGEFVPVQFTLVTAKYGIPGRASRTVRSAVRKIVPDGMLNAPVKITASAALLGSDEDEPDKTTAAKNVPKDTKLNVLTVTYRLGTQEFKKEAVENTFLVIP